MIVAIGPGHGEKVDPDDLNLKYLIPVAVVLVMTIGIVVAVIKAKLGKKRMLATPAWARGAYSLWTGGEDSGAWDQARAVNALASWYGATNAQSFWNVVNGLRQGQTGNVAWDQVRALDLLRMAVAARYIDEEKCWLESGAIGRYLQGKFRSWEELAQSFEAGMHAWQDLQNMRAAYERNRVQRNLPLLRAQIWPSVPFQMGLASDDD